MAGDLKMPTALREAATFSSDGIVCPACRGSGRQITETNFRACSCCRGDGGYNPPPNHSVERERE